MSTVTSSPSSARPPSVVSGTRIAAVTPASRLFRAAVVVLALAVVAAAASTLGTLWIVRAGVAVAVAGGIVALVLAVRGARRDRSRLRAEVAAVSLTQSRAHGEQLHAERAHNAAVLDTLTGRITAQAADLSQALDQVAAQTEVIGALRSTISTQRGDKASLRLELARREQLVAELRAKVDAHERELASLRAADGVRLDGTAVDDDASVNASIDVVGMPRRAQRSQWDALPTAEDLWSDGDHPTVADLELGEAI